MELEGGKGICEVGGDHLRVIEWRGRSGDASPVGRKGHFMRRLGESLDDLLPSVAQTLSLLALALIVFLGSASWAKPPESGISKDAAKIYAEEFEKWRAKDSGKPSSSLTTK